MKKTNLYAIVLMVGLFGCYGSGNIYQSEKTKDVDFKKYKTYAWSPTKDTAYTKFFDKARVERTLATSVIAELTKRGMTLDTLHPDCLFTYTLVMNKSYQVGDKPPEVYNVHAYA